MLLRVYNVRYFPAAGSRRKSYYLYLLSTYYSSNYHVTFVRERGRIDVDLVVGLDSGIFSGCSMTESGDSRELGSSAVHS